MLEAACILRGVEPTVLEAQKLLSDNFMWIIKYDKTAVSEETLAKVKKYIINPEFNPNGIEDKAAKWLCSWVIAVYKFANVFKLVEPKRSKVAEADQQVSCCSS